MRRRLLGLALAGLLPAFAASAAVLPGLYDVTEVDTGSVLNVRAAPETGAQVLGKLKPDARAIEVTAISADGGWGRINFGEASGWASLDFLKPQPDVWAEGALPQTLRCFGTEPFWSLRHQNSTLVEARPGEPDQTLAIDSVHGGAGTPQRVVVAHTGDAKLTLGIAPEQCTDTMSDRSFALGALLSQGTDKPQTGCCSIAP